MKRQLTFSEFVRALKRNNPQTCDVMYTKRGYYLRTRKAYLFVFIQNLLERHDLNKLAIKLGYIPYSLEVFLND